MNISIQNELRKITKKTNFFLKKIALWWYNCVLSAYYEVKKCKHF